VEVDTPSRVSVAPHLPRTRFGTRSQTQTLSPAMAPRQPPLAQLAELLVLATLTLGCRGEGEVLDLSEPLSEPAAGRCALDVLDAASDLAVARTLTSDWESGSCYELMLTNNAETRQEWWVLVELTPTQATVDNRWNHTATAIGGSASEWRGIASSNNTTLEAGASTAVGACFSC